MQFKKMGVCFKMYRSYSYLLVVICLISCNYPGAGALGGWARIQFPVQKSKLKFGIDSLRKASWENEIPERFQYDSEYWIRDSPYLEGEVLYCKDLDEMYFFSYLPNVEGQRDSSITIALRSVFRNGHWHRKDDFSIAEQKEVLWQFTGHIITPLEQLIGVKSRAEADTYELADLNNENSKIKSNVGLTVIAEGNVDIKRGLSLKEKADSAALTLLKGKFDLSTVHVLEQICADAKPEDLTMQFFTTTVEELFYSHMASFTDYYIVNPGSCLKAKLKQSMEEYMSAYPVEKRPIKNMEKEHRILTKARREHFRPKQLVFLQTLFRSVNLK